MLVSLLHVLRTHLASIIGDFAQKSGTCTQCSSKTNSMSCSTWSGDYGSLPPPLATCSIPDFLLTRFTYAPHSYSQGTILSQRHCHSDSISQFSWTASVRQQFPLRAAVDETQIWSALFLIRCTSRLEHSTAITATLNRLNGSCKLFSLNEPFLSLDY